MQLNFKLFKVKIVYEIDQTVTKTVLISLGNKKERNALENLAKRLEQIEKKWDAIKERELDNFTEMVVSEFYN